MKPPPMCMQPDRALGLRAALFDVIFAVATFPAAASVVTIMLKDLVISPYAYLPLLRFGGIIEPCKGSAVARPHAVGSLAAVDSKLSFAFARFFEPYAIFCE